MLLACCSSLVRTWSSMWLPSRATPTTIRISPMTNTAASDTARLRQKFWTAVTVAKRRLASRRIKSSPRLP